MAVLVLCIGALFATDDVWLVVLIFVAIVLAGGAIAVLFWRMLAAGGDNVSTADADDAIGSPGSEDVGGRRPS